MEKKKMAKRGRPAGQPQKARAIRDPNLPPIERKRINDSDFVKAVVRAKLTGQGMMQVAEFVGCSYAAALSKFKRLQELGVNLPDVKGGRKLFDAASLNREIQALLNQD